MTLADFLTKILDMVLMWFPHLSIVKTTHGGCRWACGNNVKEMLSDNGVWMPYWSTIFLPFGVWLCFYENRWRTHWDDWFGITGLHWYWPLVTEEPMLIPLMEQTAKFSKQMLTTKDQQPLYVRGLLKYEVANPVWLLTKCEGYDDIAEDLGLAIIKSVVVSLTLAELRDDQLKGDRELTRKIKAELKRLGINALGLKLTDFSTGDPIIHLTDLSREGIENG